MGAVLGKHNRLPPPRHGLTFLSSRDDILTWMHPIDARTTLAVEENHFPIHEWVCIFCVFWLHGNSHPRLEMVNPDGNVEHTVDAWNDDGVITLARGCIADNASGPGFHDQSQLMPDGAFDRVYRNLLITHVV